MNFLKPLKGKCYMGYEFPKKGSNKALTIKNPLLKALATNYLFVKKLVSQKLRVHLASPSCPSSLPLVWGLTYLL